MKRTSLLLALLLPVLPIAAQPQRLTLDDCREMAVRADKDLDQARTRIEMAGYDRKIALANYFPNISATGAYMYNDRDIALISEEQSALLTGAGTLMQAQLEGAVGAAGQQLSGAMNQAMTQLMTAIQTNPALAQDGGIRFNVSLAYLSSLRATTNDRLDCHRKRKPQTISLTMR